MREAHPERARSASRIPFGGTPEVIGAHKECGSRAVLPKELAHGLDERSLSTVPAEPIVNRECHKPTDLWVVEDGAAIRRIAG